MMEVQVNKMLHRRFLGHLPLVSLFASLAVLTAAAQTQKAPSPLTVTNKNTMAFFQAPPKPYDPATNVSGMYTFLKEGEFVQLTEEDGQLTGFVSRFGDTDDDKGEFIDHFFDEASLHGDRLIFKTKTVHAVWYEFDGTLTTVAGKQKGEEGYRVIRGKVTLHKSDAAGKDQANERTVEFQSFPDAEHMRNK